MEKQRAKDLETALRIVINAEHWHGYLPGDFPEDLIAEIVRDCSILTKDQVESLLSKSRNFIKLVAGEMDNTRNGLVNAYISGIDFCG